MNSVTPPSIIALGSRAAFHGAPGDGVELLTEALRARESAQTRWLLGVCYASTGRLGTAIASLEPLTDHEVALGDAGWAGLAHTTVASCLRQVGEHPRAATHDEQALAIAEAVPAVEFDAWIGLAADAVGIGDADLARERWWRAAAACPVDDWRADVRRDWVDAEIDLMTDDAGAAAAVSRMAADASRRAQAPRHLAKSLLFEGVAVAEEGDQTSAVDLLTEAADIAASLELHALRWPIEASLARWDPGRAELHLTRAGDSARFVRNDLPESLSQLWTARPEIRALIP